MYSDHTPSYVSFFLQIVHKKGVISAYLQILLLDFSPQYHILGICDVQSS